MTSRSTHIRFTTLGLAGAITLSLAACGGSTGGSGSPAAAASSGAAGSSSSSSSSSGGGAVPAASSAKELAAEIVQSTSNGTTLHLTLDTAGAGAAAEAGSGEGDVRTGSDGKTEAFTFSIGSGDTAVSLVYTDGTGYVKLPTSQQKDASKPWSKISENSSDPTIAAIAKSFTQVQDQTSLTQYAAFLDAASDFEATGATEVNGTSGQGYSMTLDASKLPTSSQFGSIASQLPPIPTTFVVDEQGRPLQVVEKVTVSSQTITTTTTFSKYGEDVDISAPPSDQVSSS